MQQALAPQLAVEIPPGGFYLWPRLAVDDETLTRRLLAEQHVRVVPGSYLARDARHAENPGAHRVRLALVAAPESCGAAAERIARVLAD